MRHLGIVHKLGAVVRELACNNGELTDNTVILLQLKYTSRQACMSMYGRGRGRMMRGWEGLYGRPRGGGWYSLPDTFRSGPPPLSVSPGGHQASRPLRNVSGREGGVVVFPQGEWQMNRTRATLKALPAPHRPPSRLRWWMVSACASCVH